MHTYHKETAAAETRNLVHPEHLKNDRNNNRMGSVNQVPVRIASIQPEWYGDVQSYSWHQAAWLVVANVYGGGQA